MNITSRTYGRYIYTHIKTTYACTLHKHSTYIWFIYLCMLYIHVRVYVYRNSMCIYTHSYIKGKSHYSLHIQSLYFYPWLAEDKLSLSYFIAQGLGYTHARYLVAEPMFLPGHFSDSIQMPSCLVATGDWVWSSCSLPSEKGLARILREGRRGPTS